jgi:hypothetical protein
VFGDRTLKFGWFWVMGCFVLRDSNYLVMTMACLALLPVFVMCWGKLLCVEGMGLGGDYVVQLP